MTCREDDGYVKIAGESILIATLTTAAAFFPILNATWFGPSSIVITNWWDAKGVKALKNSVVKVMNYSIFKSESCGIIAVRVASIRSAIATLASAKRG